MDKVFIKLFPLFNIAAIIGVLCGLAFFAMGVARYFDKIDMGRSFENIEPIWMAAGGLTFAVAIWYKRGKIKAGVVAAKARKGIS